MAETLPKPIRIEANIAWMVTHAADSGLLVGVCEALGLVSQGVDEYELSQNIQESLQLVMNDLLRSGELDGFLRSHGWSASALPVRPTNARVPFDVPFQLVAQAQDDPARAAH
jgi:predicted RNase H-like HicB family nuclease